jgi:hypothetical protein
MADKRTFRVTVARTVTYINDVYVDAVDPQEAMQSLAEQMESGDIGWFDPISWGESFFYGVEKQVPDPDQFEIIEAE